MGIWHPTIDANEIHRSCMEQWNDVDPGVTVDLEVAADKVSEFLNYIVKNKPAYPASEPYWDEDEEAYIHPRPYLLHAVSAELLPIGTSYVTNLTEEAILANQPRIIRVSYRSQQWVFMDITTTKEYGTGSPPSILEEEQRVSVFAKTSVNVEHISMDYLLFEWEDGTPILPGEAPVRRFTNRKIVLTYKNLALTDQLFDIIRNQQYTVNASTFDVYAPEKVLFSVEDVSNSVLSTHGAVFPDIYRDTVYETHPLFLYNVRMVFNIRTDSDSTWNKFWRAKRQVDGQNNEEGWYKLRYKKTSQSQDTPDFLPYPATDTWKDLWNMYSF